MKLTGENLSTRGKTCPSATLSITNPTWTDPGSNPGLRGGRPEPWQTRQACFLRANLLYVRRSMCVRRNTNLHIQSAISLFTLRTTLD
jgi:hypothetical protein